MRYILVFKVSKVIVIIVANGDTLHPDAPMHRLKDGIKEAQCTVLLSKQVLLQIMQSKGGQ